MAHGAVGASAWKKRETQKAGEQGEVPTSFAHQYNHRLLRP